MVIIIYLFIFIAIFISLVSSSSHCLCSLFPIRFFYLFCVLQLLLLNSRPNPYRCLPSLENLSALNSLLSHSLFFRKLHNIQFASQCVSDSKKENRASIVRLDCRARSCAEIHMFIFPFFVYYLVHFRHIIPHRIIAAPTFVFISAVYRFYWNCAYRTIFELTSRYSTTWISILLEFSKEYRRWVLGSTFQQYFSIEKNANYAAMNRKYRFDCFYRVQVRNVYFAPYGMECAIYRLFKFLKNPLCELLIQWNYSSFLSSIIYANIHEDISLRHHSLSGSSGWLRP